MKILIDARLYGPENTGNGRYTMNLVGELSKIDSTNEYIIFLRKKYFEELVLPTNWKKVLVDIKHYSFEEQIKLPFFISKYKPDLVHFPHINVPLFYFGKYVVTIHDTIMHDFKGGSATTRPLPLYLIWRLGYHLSFAKAVYGSKKIITPSKFVKDTLESIYRIDEEKVSVVYEGFDNRITNAKDKFAKEPYFVYVGNAYPHKNILGLIKAMKILNSRLNKTVKLFISSSRNVFTKRLKDYVTKNNATKYVNLLGFVEDSSLGSLYEGSVAFVFPSFMEGFGLTGLEAVNSGTLVLSSDIPVFREVYGENSMYFDPKNPESIADTMEKALNLKVEQRLRIITKSRSFVKRYSWSKMAKQILDIYKNEGGESSNSI